MKKLIKVFWKIIKILAFIMLSIIGTILFLTVLAIIELIFFPEKKINPYKYVKNEINIDVSNCKNLDNVYQYFRDGNAFMSFDCKNSDIIEQVNTWQKLPVTKNIDEMIYHRLSLNEEYNFTKPENGYYYFIDRYTKQYKDYDNIYSDELLLDRYATNFTIAIYDSDNLHFYYYQLDT